MRHNNDAWHAILTRTAHHRSRTTHHAPAARPPACGAGQAYDPESEVCIGPCEPGRYLRVDSVGIPACKACPKGTVAPKAGATKCLRCPKGKEPSADAAKCVSVLEACTDGKLSPGEADVDCGGACPKQCDYLQACSKGADCLTGVCTGGACACPARSDGKEYVGISRDRKTCECC